ncbi:alcohol dehydrogenase catalytic domain-containing protein [Streptomyces sp. NPDC058632]|uniref:alcohol dehydrogenase catalytic domain-containing protein n=1 Tax=unclassified Streptomyces TaxID=2593676 RepID=UPI0036644A97
MPEAEAAVDRPGTGTFAWETLQVDAPHPDELLVRIGGVGICHTDLAIRDEHLHTPMPAVLGHEGAGVMEAVGSAVTRARPGDRGLLSFSSCGYCPACLHGHPAYCTTFIPRSFDGAWSEASMPFGRARCIRRRKDMPVTPWRRPWIHNALYAQHQTYRRPGCCVPDKIAKSNWSTK